MDIEDFSFCRRPRAKALIPFAVFLVFYLGLSLVSGDFYQVPMPVAFLVASATALVLNRKASLKSKIDLFAHGMGNIDIMTMCLIFILAGAFANTAKAMGAVDATVAITLAFVPPQLLIGGLFLVACFISLAIGTSVGTVVALTPIALGFMENLDLSIGLCLGAVIGGAMFGDNLSMISDTTIAATRTQQVEMNRKFYANCPIAIPAAAFTVLAYIVFAPGTAALPAAAALTWGDALRMLPYLAVLIPALFGVNVMALLMTGTLLAGVVGMSNGSFHLFGFLKGAGDGALSMAETLIVALLAGGMLKVIRYEGGIAYLLGLIERHIKGRRGGEFGIALLVSAVNVFTANNTVAIVIAGPIARDIAQRYRIPAARSASILDTASCIIQGVLPYGAQVLAAVGLAGGVTAVSAFDVLSFLWYPYLLALILILAIATGFPRRRPLTAAD